MKKPLGNSRVTGTEQYYTPRPLARELVSLAETAIPNFAQRHFLEPAGGNGSFINALQEQGITQLTAVDLYPKHELVEKSNFLQFSHDVPTHMTPRSNLPYNNAHAASHKS